MTAGLELDPIHHEIDRFYHLHDPNYEFSNSASNYLYSMGVNVERLLAECMNDQEDYVEMLKLSDILKLFSVGTVNLERWYSKIAQVDVKGQLNDNKCFVNILSKKNIFKIHHEIIT